MTNPRAFPIDSPDHAAAIARAFTNLYITNNLIRHLERTLITSEIRIISPAAATERLQLHTEFMALMTSGSDEAKAMELQHRILAIERGVGDWIARGQISVYREVVRRAMCARHREWESCGLLVLGRRRLEAGLDVMRDVFKARSQIAKANNARLRRKKKHGPLEYEDKLGYATQMAMLGHIEDMRLKRNMDFVDRVNPMAIRWPLTHYD